ncbi:MAG: gliding motility lipoprotein GldD [Cytophagales bacterium]|nr:MAG: gliding motility lipoprotein GldD [Cytophagales bacterium]TAF61711.1 MAG: gliding motility lipoprotein GldD [Cytophagales bacterium]
MILRLTRVGLGLLALMTLAACNTNTYVPKQRGYSRIELPEKAYKTLPDSFPYTFETSQYARLMPDTSQIAEQYWVQLDYSPTAMASIHVSYKAIKNKQELFEDYINDTYKLAAKHNIKASSIEHETKKTPKGYGLTLYNIEGDVPTTFHIAITDSAKHYFRAALYVPSSVLNDSLAPVIEYVKADMMRMIETFEFKDQVKTPYTGRK